MMISTKGRYALRVMLDLADHNTGEYIPLKDIAQRQEISVKYLENILASLSRANLVDAIRGKGGGYRLCRAPEAYAAGEIIRLAEGSLDAARRRLMDILCNYAGYRRCVPILVFDAYKVRGGAREVERYHNLYVVYTREAETADMYIERATHELAKERRTRVVSSDGAEQVIVLGHGALRVSARAFAEEVAAVEKEIREFLQQ